MGGSSGGGYETVTPSWGDYSYYDPNDPDKLRQLFLGTTSSEPVTTSDSGFAPAMTPGQQGVGGFVAPTSDTGPGTGSNLTTTVHPTDSGTKSFGDWLMSKEGAAALQKTSESLKDPQSNQAPKGSTLTPAQMGSGSTVVRGNTQTLNQLMQLLSQRRYSPIGYSGGSSTRGLMGY